MIIQRKDTSSAKHVPRLVLIRPHWKYKGFCRRIGAGFSSWAVSQRKNGMNVCKYDQLDRNGMGVMHPEFGIPAR